MSAQKELVELNATTGHWSDETERKAAHWVDKHGPSIAELIQAAARIKGIAAGQQSLVYIGEAAIRELCEPLTKLTEPKV
jgi:hypothetical protein